MSFHSQSQKELIKARQQQNQKIVEKIRQKFRPLKQQRELIFPSIKSKSLHFQSCVFDKKSHQQPKSQMFSYDINLHPQQLIYNEQQHPLVVRANSYVRQIRNSPQKQQNLPINSQQKNNQGKMQKYIKILQTTPYSPNSQLNNRYKKIQQIKNLRQQLQKFNQHQPYFLTIVQADNQKDKEKATEYSYQQSSLLNAKIRKRLNHTKIIHLYR